MNRIKREMNNNQARINMGTKMSKNPNFVQNMAEADDFSYKGEASLSPIPLSVGSAIIKPEDKNEIRSNAVEAMHHYANQGIDLLRKQAELIMEQVKEIEERVRVSEKIYESEMRFTPKIGGVYHLYEKDDRFVISLVGPEEWGKKMPYKKFLASVKLLGDHSWNVIRKG